MAIDPTSAGKPLKQELALFERHLDKWRKSHLGEFVLIKGGDTVGFFKTLQEAFREGTRRYGLGDFFVKQIAPADSVNVSLFGQRVLSR